MSKQLFLGDLVDEFSTSWGYDLIGSQPWLAARSQLIQLSRQTPGGFMPLEYIYANQPTGPTWVHRAIDAYYLHGPLARGVRIRLQQAVSWLRQEIEARAAHQETISILSLASGGARDIIQAVADAPWRERVDYLGIDIDPDAVQYAREQARTAGLNGRIRFEVGNALRPPRAWEARFDIVYSLGLLDYLRDRTAVRFINRVYDMLRPDGAFLFGMVTSNPNQRFFEDYLNWRMIYRSPDHILSLAKSSKFTQIHPVSDFDEYFFLVECQKMHEVYPK